MEDITFAMDRVEGYGAIPDESLSMGVSEANPAPPEDPDALPDTAAQRGASEAASHPSEHAAVIEALLFASDAPLSAGRLADLVGAGNARDIKLAIAGLNAKYAQAGLSFRIETIAGGFQLLTLPQYQPWLAKLDNHRAQTRLSGAALETLSIVAYKQPIIRADIEAIRGCAAGEVLNRLREMGLIKIVGRAEVVGRPMLYGTTRKFLDMFGLSSPDDLPPMEALHIHEHKAEVAAAEPDRSRAAAGA